MSSYFNELQVSKLRYLGPKELTQYYVKSTNMTKINYGEYTAVLVFVVLGRRFLSNFLTIYLPTILLNIIGHTTVYFKEEFSGRFRGIGLCCLKLIAFTLIFLVF